MELTGLILQPPYINTECSVIVVYTPPTSLCPLDLFEAKKNSLIMHGTKKVTTVAVVLYATKLISCQFA